jgi:hypothetical protein
MWILFALILALALAYFVNLAKVVEGIINLFKIAGLSIVILFALWLIQLYHDSKVEFFFVLFCALVVIGSVISVAFWVIHKAQNPPTEIVANAIQGRAMPVLEGVKGYNSKEVGEVVKEYFNSENISYIQIDSYSNRINPMLGMLAENGFTFEGKASEKRNTLFDILVESNIFHLQGDLLRIKDEFKVVPKSLDEEIIITPEQKEANTKKYNAWLHAEGRDEAMRTAKENLEAEKAKNNKGKKGDV